VGQDSLRPLPCDLYRPYDLYRPKFQSIILFESNPKVKTSGTKHLLS
jgi:hypothetical protein